MITVLQRKRKKCYFKISPSYIERHWFKTGDAGFLAFGIGQIHKKIQYMQIPNYWPLTRSLSTSWFAPLWSHRKLKTKKHTAIC